MGEGIFEEKNLQMKIERASLLQDLASQTRDMIKRGREFLQADGAALRFKEAESAWNALECLEHLNLYGDFYLPVLDERMRKAGASPGASHYRTGWFGAYSVKLMQQEKGGKKMNTQTKMNPLGGNLPDSTVDRFLEQQERMLALLEMAGQADLGKVKIPVTISPFIKLKLGDALQFLAAHNARHLAQAERAVAAAQKAFRRTY